jgi:hypothetical protein
MREISLVGSFSQAEIKEQLKNFPGNEALLAKKDRRTKIVSN